VFLTRIDLLRERERETEIKKKKERRIFQATIGSWKRSNDGSEPDICPTQVHLIRPSIARPVSVHQIVLRTEHSGTLLLADVWIHDIFFSTSTLCL
jgi:hypothetical protein